ncbi:MAG: hypothetical protein R3C10_07800 [Pirellulales bacterium]
MLLLAEASTTSYVFLLLLIGVIAWMMFRVTRRLNPKDTPTSRKQRPHMAAAAHAAASPELDKWNVEVQELARDALARIDTKMRALDYLITKADQATERLEAVLEATTNGNVERATPRVAVLKSGAAAETHSQADVLQRTTGRTHHCDTANDDTERGAGVTAQVHSATEARRRRIYELADRGELPAAIAAEVGSPLGEVELILGLRRSEL